MQHILISLRLKISKIQRMFKKPVFVIVAAPVTVTALALALGENVWSYSWPQFYLYLCAFVS